jgi:hypothetical protein
MSDMDGFLHARQMPTIICALNTDDDVEMPTIPRARLDLKGAKDRLDLGRRWK